MSDQPSNSSSDRERTILYVGLAVGFVLCMILAWLPLSVSLSRFVFEDSFYYLSVARNLVAGKGSSFDGIHATNGYHPLWMLVSMLLVWPFEAGSATPVHLLLSLCAIFHVLTAFMIYKTVLLGGHRMVAVIAALAWLFNYNVAGIAMCGLETSLFAFLVITTVYYYLLRRHEMSAGQSVRVGLLLGLTALARFDGALLGFAVAADQLWQGLRKRESFGRIVARVVPMSLVGSAMMVPWMVWSWSVSGTIIPHSHRAVNLWYSPIDHFRQGVLPGLAKMVAGHAPLMARMYGLVPLSALALILLAAFLVVLFGGREKRAVGLPVIIFVVYPLAHALYYGLFFRLYNRYLYPAHLLVFTGMMTVIGCWLLANRRRRLARLLGTALGVVVAVNFALEGVKTWRQGTTSTRTHSIHWTMYNEVLPWIKANVQPHERVGAFNSGIYGYFSGRTIVNLDGVMNDSVLPALEKRQLIRYLYDERITYVIDMEKTLDTSFEVLGGVPDYRRKFAVVKVFEQPWGPLTGLRIVVLRLM